MKKFLFTSIIFLLLFFVVSCGNSSKKENTTPDSDNTGNDTNINTDNEIHDENTDEEIPDENIPTDDDSDKAPLSDEERKSSIKNLAEEYVNFANGAGVVVGFGTDKLSSVVYGIRNSENKEKMAADDLFEIGGITKSFTAVTLLLLQEEEKIELDQTIDKWFPKLAKSDKITVRMLLNHSSGIKEITGSIEPSEIVDNINGRFNFEPGTGSAYSNSNYILAGLIIGEVAGKPAHEVIREKILTPLELTHTFMKGYEEAPAGVTIASGHLFDKHARLVPSENTDKLWTAGGLVSNVEDLFKYGNELFNGKILSEKSMEEMLNKEENSSSGLGILYGIGTHGIFYGHIGDAFSSNSLFIYYPKNHEIHIILNNFNENKDLYILNDEMEWVLMDNIPIEKKTSFPNWSSLTDTDENTQVFALYSLMSTYVNPLQQSIDYGIGYFSYPEDAYPNYYCKQNLLKNTDLGSVRIIQECVEPKEYYDTSFKVQRTDIDIKLEDFEKAAESKEATKAFYVTKYDYFYDPNEKIINKICYNLEDNGNDQQLIIGRDSSRSYSEFYRIWGKAKMGKSTRLTGCHCYKQNEENQLEEYECENE